MMNMYGLLESRYMMDMKGIYDGKEVVGMEVFLKRKDAWMGSNPTRRHTSQPSSSKVTHSLSTSVTP